MTYILVCRYILNFSLNSSLVSNNLKVVGKQSIRCGNFKFEDNGLGVFNEVEHVRNFKIAVSFLNFGKKVAESIICHL